MFGLKWVMFGLIWPFDFSSSGMLLILFGIIMYISYLMRKAAEAAKHVANKAIESGVVQHVGRNVLANWIDSYFRR